jgi:hypothetical protein
MTNVKKAQEGVKLNSFKKVIGDSTTIKKKADSLGLSINSSKNQLQKKIQQKKSQGATKMKKGGIIKKK